MIGQFIDTMGTTELVAATNKWSDKIWDWLTNMEMWQSVLFAGLRVLLIFILTRIFIKIIHRLIDQSLERREKSRLQMNPRRFITVGELLKNITSFTSNLIMLMLVLGSLALNWLHYWRELEC